MKLLSFGEIIWDIYNQNEQTLGGAPLNFAAYTALLGNSAWLASCVGNDKLGKEALEQIKELGVKSEYISISEEKETGQCRISLDKSGVPSYNILEDVSYDYISLPDKLPTNFDTIAFGTLALRKEHNQAKLKNILENNYFSEIYTDLNLRAPFYSERTIDFCLSNATIVKISDEELPLVTKALFNEILDLEDATASITRKYSQIKLLLITCGAKGAYCYDCQNEKMNYCPSEPVVAVSTVGAGDSFGASFLSFYDKTKDIPRSLKLSAKISAFVVAHKEAIPKTVKNFTKQLLSDDMKSIPSVDITK